MSKKTIMPSTTMILVHAVLTFVTFGFWLLPLGLHYASAVAYGRKPNLAVTAFHTFMCTITVSIWLYGLIVWYLIKYAENH